MELGLFETLREMTREDARNELVAYIVKNGALKFKQDVPAIWEHAHVRKPVLDLLHRCHFFDEYVARGLSYVEDCLEFGWPRRSIAGVMDTIFQIGARRELADLADRLAVLQEIAVLPVARAYMATGRLDDARRLLSSQQVWQNAHRCYTRAWLEHHLGDAARADDFRRRAEALTAEYAVHRAKSAMRPDVTSDSFEEARQSLDALEFDFAGRDPKAAAVVAKKYLRAVRRECSELESVGLPRDETLYLRSLNLDERHRGDRFGASVTALIALCFDSEAVIVADETQIDSCNNARSLPPVSEEKYYATHWAINPGMYGRAADTYNVLRGVNHHGNLRMICPFTGEFVFSTKTCVFPEILAYAFEGGYPFWVISAGWKWGAHWIFDPRTGGLAAINALCPPERIRDVVSLLPELTANTKAGTSRPIVVLSGFNENIGHYYHNELAGAHRAAASGSLPGAATLCIGPFDHYGVAKLLKLPGEQIVVQDWAEAARRFDPQSHLVIWPTAECAPRTLGDLIVEHAERRHGRDLAELLRGRERDLIVVLGMRTKRRIWRSEAEVLPALLPDVVEAAKRLGFRGVTALCDGYTATLARDQIDPAKVQAEHDRVERLFRSAERADLKVINCVGMTLYEKAALFSRAHLAFCPKGNGHLPTVAWVVRVPAIIHSNAADLMGGILENMFCEVTPGLSIVDRSDVSGDLSNHHGPGFGDVPIHVVQNEDYELSVAGVKAKLLQAIASVTRPPSVS